MLIKVTTVQLICMSGQQVISFAVQSNWPHSVVTMQEDDSFPCKEKVPRNLPASKHLLDSIARNMIHQSRWNPETKTYRKRVVHDRLAERIIIEPGHYQLLLLALLILLFGCFSQNSTIWHESSSSGGDGTVISPLPSRPRNLSWMMTLLTFSFPSRAVTFHFWPLFFPPSCLLAKEPATFFTCFPGRQYPSDGHTLTLLRTIRGPVTRSEWCCRTARTFGGRKLLPDSSADGDTEKFSLRSARRHDFFCVSVCVVTFLSR